LICKIQLYDLNIVANVLKMNIHLVLAKNAMTAKCDALVPHYKHMRTLSRRIYEIRQLNIWLLQIDEALKFGNVDKINLLVYGNKVNW
jgi:hypothetical protein